MNDLATTLDLNRVAGLKDAYSREWRLYEKWIQATGEDYVAGLPHYLEELQQPRNGRRLGAQTVGKRVYAVKARLRQAFALSEYAMDGQAAHRLETVLRSVKPPRKQQTRARWLEWAEVEKLIASTPTRLSLLIKTLAFTGCRIAELLDLMWSDITPCGAVVALRVLHGKGNKERIVYLDAGTLEAIRKAFDPGEYLFFHSGRRYEATSVTRRIRAASMRILGKPATAHTLRHSFASRAMTKLDLAQVADLLGHSSPAVTAKTYIHSTVRPEGLLQVWSAA